MTSDAKTRENHEWNLQTPYNREPVGDWAARQFDFIPARAVIQLCECGQDRMVHLNAPKSELSPARWPKTRYLSHPREQEMQNRIRTHAQKIRDLGFWVYESLFFGLLLETEQNGHLFYQQNWEALQEFLEPACPPKETGEEWIDLPKNNATFAHNNLPESVDYARALEALYPARGDFSWRRRKLRRAMKKKQRGDRIE